ncbi:MAG: hypothetical protein IRZ00_13975 [Gemmatimonadetes bacterium]|nr:hypothetical protein [Gemmatimonadota bacterium]
MPEIRQRKVLEQVLLRTLAQYPAGVSVHDAYDLIDSAYTFPAEWYRQIPASQGYDELRAHGYTDWRVVPQDRLIELVPTEPQWQNELRWARNELRKRDFLDASAARGSWKLTAAGLAAARRTTPEEMTPEERTIIEIRRVRPEPAEPSILGRRAKLIATLDNLTHSMPLPDLELVIDLARAVRRRGLKEVA